MEPAGGETGEPHCLAEVYELPKAALLLYFILKSDRKKVTLQRNPVKQKIEEPIKLLKGFIFTPHYLNRLVYNLRR